MTFLSWIISKFRRRRRRRSQVPIELSALSDHTLSTIISNLPLCSQISMLRVSKRFNVLITDILISRTSLALIITRYPSYPLRLITGSSFTIPCADQLRANPGDRQDSSKLFSRHEAALDGDDVSERLISSKKFNSKTVVYLRRTFPRITELKVVIDGYEPKILSDVMRLIDNCALKLKILKIWMDLDVGTTGAEVKVNPEHAFLFTRLICTINRCRSLTHLTIDTPTILFTDSPSESPLDLTILSHLESLNFFTNFNVSILLTSLLVHAAPNSNLKTLAIGNKVCPSKCVRLFQELSVELAQKFTSLTLFFPLLHELPLRELAEKFSSLQVLSIDKAFLPLINLAYCLSPLKKLVHLTLYIDFFHRSQKPLNSTDTRDRSTIFQLPPYRFSLSSALRDLILMSTLVYSAGSSQICTYFALVETTVAVLPVDTPVQILFQR